MDRRLKNAVFVQSIPYAIQEKRLAQYHGAIFAEYLQSKCVHATKMVVGDPRNQMPASPLLSVSSPKQRIDPAYWYQKKFDIVVLYGGVDFKNISVMRAIKNGSPETVLILKMDAAYGPFCRSPRDILKSAYVAYIKDRHGHSGKHGHASSLPLLAFTRAFLRTLRLFSPVHTRQLSQLFRIPDFVSYESTSALTEAKRWLRFNNMEELERKVIWLGYPVRDTFSSTITYTKRTQHSIISVANWKHAKDLNLHARALAKVFKDDLSANFTLIGENSALLQKLILELSTNSASRISRIDELSNTELPHYLHNSQVFMLCSFTEGYCSAVVEALCSGCSVALTTGLGVPCFKGFSNNECGTQAKSRSPDDMADAVSYELNAWRKGMRNPFHIKNIWQKTLVSNLCGHLCDITGFSLPDF